MTKKRSEETHRRGESEESSPRPEDARDSGRGPGVAPEGIEPGGDLGPESWVATDAPEGFRTELERLRARENELLRAVAEQQNVTRRRRQEMESSVQFAQEALVRDLLPVLDDFERALGAMEGTTEPSIRDGVSLVADRLLRILTAQGLEAIRPGNDPFDPSVHEAVAQRPVRGAKEGTVVALVEPGYRFRGRLLRPAKVIVAAAEEQGTDARQARHAAG
ncbi:MAG TPA: nucleotide exchange factor GrpE [Candidatus Eisenbacteria bacterium]|nr:nucleotide exchange factor GrpE [Candidatus Eisenbacteria bacterium]